MHTQEHENILLLLEALLFELSLLDLSPLGVDFFIWCEVDIEIQFSSSGIKV